MNEKILRKLLALKEMAERGTENEALIAAEKLQQEMLKYGLETIDITTPEVIRHTIVSGKVPTWKKNLIITVSKSIGIPVYRCHNGEWVLIGRKELVNTLCQQYDRLLAVIERLAKPYKGLVAKNSFRTGFILRLYHKLTISEDGLILIGRYRQEAEDFMGFTPRKGREKTAARTDRDSFLAGYAAGDNYNSKRGGLNGLA